MASGYGLNGGTSRCFPFWQAVVKCYAETDNPGKCTLHKEDYNECLHHTKAKAKEKRIKEEFAKIRAQGVQDLKRQSDIYKSMGRAGGASVGLIEHIIAKSSIAQHQGTGTREQQLLAAHGIKSSEGEPNGLIRVDWEVPKSQ